MAIYLPHVMDIDGTKIVAKVSEADDRQVVTSAPLADGSIERTHNVVTDDRGKRTIQCMDIDTVLSEIGVAGATLSTITWYDAVLAEAGAKSSSSVHVLHTMSDGYGIPRNISVTSKGSATISFDVKAEVSSKPWTIAADQALGAGTPGVDKQYGMGPLSVNGSAVSQIESVNINFGNSELEDTSDGAIGVNEIKTGAHLPVLSFACGDSEFKATVDNAIALSSTGLVFYLRRRAVGGTHYVADETTEHIKIAIKDGLIKPAGTTTVGGRQVSNFVVEGQKGTAASIVITTGSAIT